ncbi:hypothetical protein HpMS204_12320 [Helicobacter pylori]
MDCFKFLRITLLLKLNLFFLKTSFISSNLIKTYFLKEILSWFVLKYILACIFESRGTIRNENQAQKHLKTECENEIFSVIFSGFSGRCFRS